MKEKTPSFSKLMEHPDRDIIISKLCMDVSPIEIVGWLEEKYSAIGEKKLILSEKSIKLFKDNYLDFYTYIKQDLKKTKNAIQNDIDIQSLELSVKNNPSYKAKMMSVINTEVDIKKIIATSLAVIESKIEQIYDQMMTNPDHINSKLEYPLIQWFSEMGNWIERQYKMIEQGPDQIVQHNIAIQSVDAQVAIIQDVIREVLAQVDIDASLLFMDLVNEKLSKLKMPNDHSETAETRLIQAKILNDDINQRLNS